MPYYPITFKKSLIYLVTFIIIGSLYPNSSWAQSYERYKKLTDTTIKSSFLGFDKKISITVPIEWQKGATNKFPLIIVFDRQNKRSHQYILNTIDYLTSNEQMPSSIIISVESEQRYRFIETIYKESMENGKAFENEQFIFKELMPMAEENFNASSMRFLIGHSRYGYFTTSVFSNRTKELTGVISMSPFFYQDNSDLVAAIQKLGSGTYGSKKYYRFGIGNDYPEDYQKMANMLSATKTHAFLDIKGQEFKQADHNVTPGLIIGPALYEIFENWSANQRKYSVVESKDLGIKKELDQAILHTYGAPINFSIGVLNGKGWQFYNEEKYDLAIQAWEILMTNYPNFTSGYVAILEAQVNSKKSAKDKQATIEKFKKSLATSTMFTAAQKKEMEAEVATLIKKP